MTLGARELLGRARKRWASLDPTRRRGALAGLAGLALLLVSALTLGHTAGSSSPGGPAPDPLDGPGVALDITLKLLAVLALIYLVLAVLRRYSLGVALGQRQSALRVIESTNLAPNRSLFLVTVEGRRLLLGVTPSQISTLAELEPKAEEESLPSGPPPPASRFFDPLR